MDKHKEYIQTESLRLLTDYKNGNITSFMEALMDQPPLLAAALVAEITQMIANDEEKVILCNVLTEWSR